ncbi:hypothetical protein GDO86_019797, partial [Hymenochirus boettgeri]
MLVLFLLGITINGFIVVTFCLEWVTNKNLNDTDIILMCLGMTRFFWHLFFVLLFLPNIVPAVFNVFYGMATFLNWSSLWIVSVLCVIYCVKISNYTNFAFMYVKLRISKMVKWLILASLLSSLTFTLLFWFVWEDYTFTLNNSTTVALQNDTETYTDTEQGFSSTFFIYYLATVLPFVIFCVAVLLLIHSLLIHTQQMKSSATGLGRSHMGAHLSVLKKMVFSLVLYVVYFINNSLASFQNLSYETVWQMIYFIVDAFYPSAHSIFLIYSDGKLKKAIL